MGVYCCVSNNNPHTKFNCLIEATLILITTMFRKPLNNMAVCSVSSQND